MENCIRAQIGTGVVVADTRPFIEDPIPAKLFLYLSKPSEKGQIASFGVMAVLDESSKPYREIGLLQSLGPLSFTTGVYDDPTPDGRYGLRLALPAGPVGIVKISLAELRVTTPGISQVSKTITCVKRAGGRCVKRRRRRRAASGSPSRRARPTASSASRPATPTRQDSRRRRPSRCPAPDSRAERHSGPAGASVASRDHGDDRAQCPVHHS